MPGDDPIEVTEEADRTRLVLRGRVTAEHTGPLHAAAVAAARRGLPVAVECGAGYVHAAAVQVLYALRRDVRAGGRGFDITAAGPGGDALRHTGLAGSSGNGG